MKDVGPSESPCGGDFKPPTTALVEDLVNMNADVSHVSSVRGAVRVDGGNVWTSGVALREEASNHLPGPWLKTVVLNGVGKGVATIASGVGREDERWVEKPSAD
jgi:hypothetical protein